MARTKGATDKKPRKRRGSAPKKNGKIVEVKRGEPFTNVLEITPSDNLLFEDGRVARAVFVSADEAGLYDVDWEIKTNGEYDRVRQPFAVIEQTHDSFGEPIEEPYFTSPVFPVNVRRIYAEGTRAPRVMIMY